MVGIENRTSAHARAQNCCTNLAKRVQPSCNIHKCCMKNLTIFKFEPTTPNMHVALHHNRVAKCTQHVAPNNVAICCVVPTFALYVCISCEVPVNFTLHWSFCVPEEVSVFTFVSSLDPVPLASCNECRLSSGLFHRVIPRSRPVSSLAKPCFLVIQTSRPREVFQPSDPIFTKLAHTPKSLYRKTDRKDIFVKCSHNSVHLISLLRLSILML